MALDYHRPSVGSVKPARQSRHPRGRDGIVAQGLAALPRAHRQCRLAPAGKDAGAAKLAVVIKTWREYLASQERREDLTRLP